MNLNKGCIEILLQNNYITFLYAMNLNKGCIEISQYDSPIRQPILDEP